MDAAAPQLDTSVFRIRHGKPEDLAYVIRTYLFGYRSALAARRLHPDEYRARVRQQIVGILQRPSAKLWIACDVADEDVILGFALLEGGCVHWVDVRERWRGMQIGKLLLAAHGTPLDRFSVWTASLDAARIPATWAYDPFAAVWGNWAETAPERRQNQRRQRARAEGRDT